MPRPAKGCLSIISLLLLCLSAGSRSDAEAAVFRDHAAFNAAAQNLRTIDFESVPADFSRDPVIDGIPFRGFTGVEVVESKFSKVLVAPTVGELTRTRVTLFLVGVGFDSPGDAALVTARAEDAQHRVYDPPVEAVGGAKNLSWMARVTVRLPAELSGAGDVGVSGNVGAAESNRATLRVD